MNDKIPTALAGLFAFSLSLFVHALSSPLSFSQRRPSQSAALTLIHSVLVSSDVPVCCWCKIMLTVMVSFVISYTVYHQ